MPPSFLIVDEFLHDALPARALQSALELGIIDRLERADTPQEKLLPEGRVDRAGGEFLWQMLSVGSIIERKTASCVCPTAFVPRCLFET